MKRHFDNLQDIAMVSLSKRPRIDWVDDELRDTCMTLLGLDVTFENLQYAIDKINTIMRIKTCEDDEMLDKVNKKIEEFEVIRREHNILFLSILLFHHKEKPLVKFPRGSGASVRQEFVNAMSATGLWAEISLSVDLVDEFCRHNESAKAMVKKIFDNKTKRMSYIQLGDEDFLQYEGVRYYDDPIDIIHIKYQSIVGKDKRDPNIVIMEIIEKKLRFLIHYM